MSSLQERLNARKQNQSGGTSSLQERLNALKQREYDNPESYLFDTEVPSSQRIPAARHKPTGPEGPTLVDDILDFLPDFGGEEQITTPAIDTQPAATGPTIWEKKQDTQYLTPEELEGYTPSTQRTSKARHYRHGPEWYEWDYWTPDGWGEDALEAAGNFPGSAFNAIKDISRPLYDPVGFGYDLYNLGRGAVEKAIPGEQPYEVFADALVEDYKNAYGSWDQFKETAIEDPVRPLMDLATILPFGGGGLKAIGSAGRKAADVKNVDNMGPPRNPKGEPTVQITNTPEGPVRGAAPPKEKAIEKGYTVDVTDQFSRTPDGKFDLNRGPDNPPIIEEFTLRSYKGDINDPRMSDIQKQNLINVLEGNSKLRQTLDYMINDIGIDNLTPQSRQIAISYIKAKALHTANKRKQAKDKDPDLDFEPDTAMVIRAVDDQGNPVNLPDSTLQDVQNAIAISQRGGRKLPENTYLDDIVPGVSIKYTSGGKVPPGGGRRPPPPDDGGPPIGNPFDDGPANPPNTDIYTQSKLMQGVETAGKALQEGSRYFNPITMTTVPVMAAGKGITAGAEMISGLTTGAGYKSLSRAEKAGRIGGKTAKSLRDAMRNATTPKKLIEETESAMMSLHTRKFNDFKSEPYKYHEQTNLPVKNYNTIKKDVDTKFVDRQDYPGNFDKAKKEVDAAFDKFVNTTNKTEVPIENLE